MIAFLESINGTPFGSVFTFGLGLIFGSFFNVVILRLPEEISLVKERSRCNSCKKTIPWFCNIPVLSFLALRGKCLFCRTKVSLQYPLVELFTGLLFWLLYLQLGLSIKFLVYGVFVSALIIVSVIDLHLQIIPDEISLPGIPLGFLMCFITGDLLWWESLLGILLGGGTFLLIAWLYEKLAKREGLGGGDVKLLGMIGAWLGFQSLLPVIVISSALGSLVGLAVMAIQRKDFKAAIPFGPFLAFGAVLYLFFSPQIKEFLFPY